MAAFEYLLDAVPTDEELLADLEKMMLLLGQLYQRTDLDPLIPGTVPPEVEAAIEDIDESAGRAPTKSGGQGFRLTKLEQRAVERRAVDVTVAHYQNLGWTVKDVGDHESFDLYCKRGGAELYVEVKGTTSLGDTILLTHCEVTLHLEKYPRNCLAVVSRISLDRSRNPSTATGGHLELLSPWAIEEAR